MRFQKTFILSVFLVLFSCGPKRPNFDLAESARYPWESWELGKTLEDDPIGSKDLIEADSLRADGDVKKSLELLTSIDPESLPTNELPVLILRLSNLQLALGQTEAALNNMSTFFKTAKIRERNVHAPFALIYGYAYEKLANKHQALAWFAQANNVLKNERDYFERRALNGARMVIDDLSTAEFKEISQDWLGNDYFITQLMLEEFKQRSLNLAVKNNILTESKIEIHAVFTAQDKADLVTQYTQGLQLNFSRAGQASELLIKQRLATLQQKKYVSEEKPSLVIGTSTGSFDKSSLLNLDKTEGLISYDPHQAEAATLKQVLAYRPQLKTIGVIYDSSTEALVKLYDKELSKHSLTLNFHKKIVDDKLQEVLIDLGNDRPDLVLLLTPFETAVRITNHLKATERERLLILGLSSWNTKLEDYLITQTHAPQIILPTGFYPASERPLVQQFFMAFKQKYGSPPTEKAALAYDLGSLAELVLRTTGQPSEAIKNITAFQGISGYFAYSPQGNTLQYQLIPVLHSKKKIQEWSQPPTTP